MRKYTEPQTEFWRNVLRHRHRWDSSLGIILGSSMWTIFNPDHTLTRVTNISGIMCRCGHFRTLEK